MGATVSLATDQRRLGRSFAAIRTVDGHGRERERAVVDESPSVVLAASHYIELSDGRRIEGESVDITIAAGASPELLRAEIREAIYEDDAHELDDGPRWGMMLAALDAAGVPADEKLYSGTRDLRNTVAAYGEYLAGRALNLRRVHQAHGLIDGYLPNGRGLQVEATSKPTTGWNLRYAVDVDYLLVRIELPSWRVVESWFVPLGRRGGAPHRKPATAAARRLADRSTGPPSPPSPVLTVVAGGQATACNATERECQQAADARPRGGPGPDALHGRHAATAAGSRPLRQCDYRSSGSRLCRDAVTSTLHAR